MPLQKTITHPQEDYHDFIQNPVLKLIVFGDRPDLVKIADDLALDPPTSIDRGVLWLINGVIPTGLINEASDLSQIDLSQIKAVSVSTKNMVADRILITDSEDYVRVEQAYTKAGLSHFN